MMTRDPPMQAYKVLAKRPDDPQLRSAWMQDSACSLEYEIGAETLPIPGTGILAFRTLEAARDWKSKTGLGDFNARAVFVAGEGVERPLPAKPVLGTSRCMSQDTAVANWDNPLEPPDVDPNVWSDSWPDDTVALESFTPTEEI